MKGIFERLDAGVFSDERALLHEYAPAEILYRGDEMRAFDRSMQGVARGSRPENLFVYGPTGTGKTTVARRVLSELAEYTDRAVPVYVNC